MGSRGNKSSQCSSSSGYCCKSLERVSVIVPTVAKSLQLGTRVALDTVAACPADLPDLCQLFFQRVDRGDVHRVLLVEAGEVDRDPVAEIGKPEHPLE